MCPERFRMTSAGPRSATLSGQVCRDPQPWRWFVIERLHEEFRRRVKTQGALPTEDAAVVLLFGLVASGQIRLRRLDGWRQIPTVLRERRRSAA